MMKSVGVVLLIATFAYSGVEGIYRYNSACGKAVYKKLTSNDVYSATRTCVSDPEGKAALTAIGRYGCGSYDFIVGPLKCEVGAAPYMKCVARKLGYLNADGSINNSKILAQYKTYATSAPKCSVAQYDFAVNKCGTTINNYAFLAKVACIAGAADQYTG
ncbi:uncharacterized protein LOC108669957 [Hyalella azteca]|uniref:Uncharacterized protein LOC108669957 n=1 Tax=Hyalella azteca TaxID=294128 RepID=A0A8B7NHP1_HYAAZ|nr:uncharacterized protein LOC108669957 [Hyalella azteca]